MEILYIEEEDRLKHKTKHERSNLMKGKKDSHMSNIVNQHIPNTNRVERCYGRGRETILELTRQINKKMLGFSKHLYNTFKCK